MIEGVFDMGKERDKKRLFQVLKTLKPIKYVFKIKQARKKRSLNQNDYYFGVIVKPLADYLGYTTEEMHDVLKLKFNPKHLTNRQTGEEFLIGGSTTDFNTLEMEQYHESIRIWALTELDFLIRLPNELE